MDERCNGEPGQDPRQTVPGDNDLPCLFAAFKPAGRFVRSVGGRSAVDMGMSLAGLLF